MSLITRCPACGTMFKVVADQLKVSEGWVRCGHCAEIFDATSNLQKESVPTSAPALAVNSQPVQVPQPLQPQVPIPEPLLPEPLQPEPEPPQIAAGLSMPDEIDIFAAPPSKPAVGPAPLSKAEDNDFGTSIHSEVDESALEGFADSHELDEQAQALRADPRDRPFELRRADVSASGPRHRAVDASSDDPDLHDLSFVRQARRKAFWRRPAVRVLLVLLGLALTTLLALQIAWNDRDRLAAAEPALRPWLSKLCEAAGCTLGPPRRIEAIAIDSSSFNKLRPDTYRLNVTLKSFAATEVAMPALELTLTDSQDQAVLRRVLLPAEFAGRTAALLPGAEWSTSLAIAVSGNSASRIAGYRVLAFYP